MQIQQKETARAPTAPPRIPQSIPKTFRDVPFKRNANRAQRAVEMLDQESDIVFDEIQFEAPTTLATLSMRVPRSMRKIRPLTDEEFFKVPLVPEVIMTEEQVRVFLNNSESVISRSQIVQNHVARRRCYKAKMQALHLSMRHVLRLFSIARKARSPLLHAYHQQLLSCKVKQVPNKRKPALMKTFFTNINDRDGVRCKAHIIDDRSPPPSDWRDMDGVPAALAMPNHYGSFFPDAPRVPLTWFTERANRVRLLLAELTDPSYTHAPWRELMRLTAHMAPPGMVVRVAEGLTLSTLPDPVVGVNPQPPPVGIVFKDIESALYGLALSLSHPEISTPEMVNMAHAFASKDRPSAHMFRVPMQMDFSDRAEMMATNATNSLNTFGDRVERSVDVLADSITRSVDTFTDAISSSTNDIKHLLDVVQTTFADAAPHMIDRVLVLLTGIVSIVRAPNFEAKMFAGAQLLAGLGVVSAALNFQRLMSSLGDLVSYLTAPNVRAHGGDELEESVWYTCIMLLCHTFSLKPPENVRLDHHRKEKVQTYLGSMNTMLSCVQGVMKIASMAFQAIYATVLQKPHPDEFKPIVDLLDTWLKEYHSMMENVQTSKIGYDTVWNRKIRDLYLGGGKLSEMLFRARAPTTISAPFAAAYQTLHLFMQRMNNFEAYLRERPVPVTIQAFGPPGHGKTTLLRIVLAKLIGLMKANGFIAPTIPLPEALYQRPNSDGFWDGYYGQPTILLDDANQNASQEARTNLCETFVKIVNSVRYPLDMAALDQKGVVFMIAMFVAISSNTEDLTHYAQLADKNAVHRRRDFVVHVSNPNWDNTTGHVKGTNINDLSQYRLEMRPWRPNPRVPVGHPDGQGEIVTVDELVSRMWKLFLERQTEMSGQIDELEQFSAHATEDLWKHQQGVLEPLAAHMPRPFHERRVVHVPNPSDDPPPQQTVWNTSFATLAKTWWSNSATEDEVLETIIPEVEVGIRTGTAHKFSTAPGSGVSKTFPSDTSWHIGGVDRSGGVQRTTGHVESQHVHSYEQTNYHYQFVRVCWYSKILPPNDVPFIGSYVDATLALCLEGVVNAATALSSLYDYCRSTALLASYAMAAQLEELGILFSEVKDYLNENPALKYMLLAVTSIAFVALATTMFNSFVRTPQVPTPLPPTPEPSPNLTAQVVHSASHEVPKGVRTVIRTTEAARPTAQNAPKLDEKSSKPGMVAHSLSDPQVADLLVSKVRSNQFQMDFSRYGTVFNYMKGVGIRDNIAVMPCHIFRYIEGLDETPESILITMHRDGFATQQFHLSDLKLVFLGSDVMGVYLPKTLPAFKNIHKHFVQDKDLNADFSNLIVCESFPKLRNQYTQRLHKVEVQLQKSVTYDFYDHNNLPREVSLARFIRANAATTPGDCGAVYMLQNTSVPRKLCALHVAGHKGMCIVIGSILSQEFLAPLFNQQQLSTIDEEPALDVTGALTAQMAITEAGISVDSMEELAPGKYVQLARGTKIVPSVLHNHPKLHPSVKGPPHMRKFISPQGEEIWPYQKAVKRATSKLPVNRLDLLRQAADQIHLKFGKPPEGEPLTLFEAINGVPGKEYMKSIVMTTSSGYGPQDVPYVLQKPDGKKKFFVLEADGYHPVASIVHDVEALESQAKVKPLTDQKFIVSLKDELLPHAKVEEGRARPTDTAGLDYLLLVRKYFLKAVQSFMEGHSDKFHAVGINPHSRAEWKTIVDRMDRWVGTNFVDGDFWNMDGSMHEDWLKEATREFALFASKNDGHYQTRYNILWALVEHYLVCGDTLLHALGSHVTGEPLTALINSIVCIIFCVASWLLITEKKFGKSWSVQSFFDNVGPVVFGDDNAQGVNPNCTFYNCRSIAEAGKDLGFVITTASKNGDEREYIPFEELTFLKRRFVPDGDGFYFAPLATESLTECIQWVRQGQDQSIILPQIVLSAASDWFHYGPERYKREMTALNEAMVDAEFEPCLVSWSNFYASWIGGRYVEFDIVSQLGFGSQFHLRPSGMDEKDVQLTAHMDDSPKESDSDNMRTAHEDVVLEGPSNDAPPIALEAADAFKDTGINGIIAREYLIVTYTWTDTLGRATIGVLQFPESLFAIVKEASNLSNFALFTCEGVEIRIQTQSTGMHSGLLQVVTQSSTPSSSVIFTDQIAGSFATHAIMGLNLCPTLIVRILYNNPSQAMALVNNPQYDVGSMAIQAITDLQVTTADASHSVPIQVFARFIKPRVFGPTLDTYTFSLSSGAPPKKSSKFLNKPVKTLPRLEAHAPSSKEAVQKSEKGLISGIAETVTGISSALSVVPGLGAIAAPIAGISSLVGSLASAFGFNMPPTKVAPVPALLSSYPYTTNGKGLAPVEVLALDPEAKVACAPESAGSTVDMMNIKNFCRQPCLVDYGSIATTVTDGTVVAVWGVGPEFGAYKSSTNTYANRTNVASSFFTFWTGLMAYELYASCSRFVSARLAISWHPAGAAIPTNIVPGDIILAWTQIQGETKMSWSVPVVSAQEWFSCYVPSSINYTHNSRVQTIGNGFLCLSVLGEVTSNNTSDSGSVEWVLYSMGANLRFNRPSRIPQHYSQPAAFTGSRRVQTTKPAVSSRLDSEDFEILSRRPGPSEDTVSLVVGDQVLVDARDSVRAKAHMAAVGDVNSSDGMTFPPLAPTEGAKETVGVYMPEEIEDFRTLFHRMANLSPPAGDPGGFNANGQYWIWPLFPQGEFGRFMQSFRGWRGSLKTYAAPIQTVTLTGVTTVFGSTRPQGMLTASQVSSATGYTLDGSFTPGIEGTALADLSVEGGIRVQAPYYQTIRYLPTQSNEQWTSVIFDLLIVRFPAGQNAAPTATQIQQSIYLGQFQGMGDDFTGVIPTYPGDFVFTSK